MTTFEITTIVLLAAIVVLLIVLLRTAIEGFHGVWQNQNVMHQDIQRIEVNTHHASSVLQDSIAPDVEIISNNFLHLLDERSVYKQPTSVNGTPCYAPDGICTNPCRDCINCPKIGTGGTWSTDTIVNKED